MKKQVYFYCFTTILVRRVSKRFGMKEVNEEEDWTIFWTDYSVSLERVMEMKRFQVGLFLSTLFYNNKTFEELYQEYV